MPIQMREGKVVPDDIGTKVIGSQHIADNAIGSSIQIGDSVIGEDQVIDNSIGYAELTTGLQGSIAAGSALGPDSVGTTELKEPSVGSQNLESDSVYSAKIANDSIGSEHYQNKSIETFSATFSSFAPQGTYPYFLAFAPDKNRLWYVDAGRNYIYELGTTTGAAIGSFAAPGVNPGGIAIATDKNRLWHADYGVDYIYEIGTTNGALIGSFQAPGTYPLGLAFAPDKNRLWHCDFYLGTYAGASVRYIYEIGTTNGALIGSFQSPGYDPIDLAFASDKNRLWHCDLLKAYIYEIGTTTGAVTGSVPAIGNVPTAIAVASDKNRLWHGDAGNAYIYELGSIDIYSHIKDDAVWGRHIKDDAITGNHIADDAIGSEHLETDAVGSSKLIKNNVIGGDHIINNSIGYGELTTGLQGTYMPVTGGTFTGSVDYSGAGKPPRLAILTPGAAIQPVTRGATGTAVHTSNLSYYQQLFNPGTVNSVFWEFQTPEYYDAGTLNFNIWWKGKAATGTVVWQIATLGRTTNETFNNALTVLGSKCTNTQGSAKVTMSTITGKPNFTADELAVIRLRRIGWNGTDTLSGSASLLMVGIDFKAEK